jgi:hypothetical protein
MRSAYDVDMVFSIDADPVRVRWYVAKDLQPWAPDGNLFVSSNWVNRETDAGDLGEQPTSKPWFSGKDTKDYPVATGDPCGIDDDLVVGLDAGETTGPWSLDGKLGCCSCACDSYPCTLHATITSLSGCEGFEQTFDLVSDGTTPCMWIGGGPDFDGSFFFSLQEALLVWTPFIDCTTPFTSFTLVTQQDAPLLLVYDADSAGCCCSGLPCTGTWRITITQ